MAAFEQYRRYADQFHRRLRARRDLRGLADANPQIADAIIDAVSGKTSKIEQAWIGRIEELRSSMSGSSEELEITDYGAGSGNLKSTEEEMHRGRRIRTTIGKVCAISRGDRTALLLFRLVRALKPHTCIELGTSVGISGCYQAAALKLNGAGKLITLEGADSLASIAVRNFASLGLDNIEVIRGRFQDTLSGVLAANPAVDYAFIDGHHEEASTVNYFNALLPVLVTSAVVVFDDIRWSEGMKRAWDVIRGHRRVRASVDLGPMGLVSAAGTECSQHFTTAF